MSAVSARIRAAALGPTPVFGEGYLDQWVDDDDFDHVAEFLADRKPTGGYLYGLTDTERRMFLLFVSEALK